MNTTYSPYASTPAADYYYDKKEYVSPSPTPSPRGPTYYHGAAQQRPATRAHFRHMSSGGATGTPSSGSAGIYQEYAVNSSSSRPPTFSPRYTSDGHYATANVSSSRSAQKHTPATTTTYATTTGPRRGRSASFSYYRASDSIGESDEDELVKIDGVTYLLPARSARRSGPVKISGGNYSPSHSRKYSQGYQDHKDYQDFQDYRHSYRYETNHPHYKQGGYGFVEKEAGPGFESPRFRDAREARDSREREPVMEPRRTTPTGPISNAAHAAHIRRSSTAMPTNAHMQARPQTARPSSSHFQGPPPTTSSRKPSGPPPATTTGTPPPRAATEADAKKHRIPTGYSLKNWDPSEEPIMLLGSVFDANSLGKWIYDWTTYHHGPQSPISEIAGELWLLLIQLAGKIKRTDDVMPRVRTRENREMLEDFIISGERLTDKLRKLLKTCEAPMMHVASSKRSKAQPQLGKGAGIEFVETMFGREREMEKTERFMQSVRLWNLRFDANCEDILRKPTQ
ncbi:vegetative cell wall protein gp1 [Ophiostoma piceae UAMH 11346]|uniref:Vegetative cell wall protein gp1 n=1 Tax=Ophiostoma piceae (strain UAMH 11346) TaxID=1262450 RepID=S3C380_OPHP1|nr:vegetative cell wall protein gp1 [Ophiostoma piceae UAMH 11346]